MKHNKHINRLFCIATAIVAISCSNADQGNDQDDTIRLKVASPSIEVETKGSIDGWNNTPVVFMTKRSNTMDVTSALEHWNAKVGTYGGVFFSPVRRYIKYETYELKGYHPKSATPPTGDKIEYLITGNEDIMVSGMINPGTIDAKVIDAIAKFRHLLTQFRFKITNDPTDPYPLVDITEISVFGTSTPLSTKATLDITNETLTFDQAVTGEVSADLGAGLKILVEDQPDAAKLMFESGKPTSIRIRYGDRVLEKDITQITPFPAGQGKSYEITLAFKGAGLVITAKLTDWKETKIGTQINIW